MTLAAGLGGACIVAAIVGALLDGLDLLPASFNGGAGALHGLTTVNSSTVLVAFDAVAGIAGMLALESRASAMVGVAISVTTIPASAYLGVAAGVGKLDKSLARLPCWASTARCSSWGAPARCSCSGGWRGAPASPTRAPSCDGGRLHDGDRPARPRRPVVSSGPPCGGRSRAGGSEVRY